MKYARKIFFMMLMVLTVSLLFPICASAAGTASNTSSNDGFFPSMEQIFSNKNPSIYLNTYRPNYDLDIKDVSGFKPAQVVGAAFNSLANICFSVQTGLTYLLVCIVYFGFQFSFVDLFSGVLKTVTGQMQNGLFNQLSSVAIASMGLFFCVRLIKQQKTQAYLAIVQTILVVAMAYAFMRYPVQIVKTIDDGSNALSQQILMGTYKAANGGQTPDSAVIGVCDNLWVMLVHQPWEYFEFGNTSYGKTIVDGKTLESRILTLNPGSDERQALINDQAADGKYFSYLAGAARIGKMLLYAIPFLLNWLIILIMCLAMLGYKLLVILLAMLGVIIFLLALIPWWGFAIIKDWAGKMVSYGAVKIILTLVVTILFIFNNIIFALNDKYGILLTLILQLLCFLMVYLERDRLFGMFTKFVSVARSAQYGPSAVRKHLKQDPGLEHKVGSMGSNAMGRVYDGIGSTTRKIGDKLGGSSENDVETQNADKANNNTNANRNQSQRSYRRNYGGYALADGTMDDRVNAPSPVSRNNQGNVFEHGADSIPKETVSNGGERVDDLKNLKKLSEQVLEFQYEQLKKQDEERSKELGKEKPEYSDYVKTAMNREARNQPKFESRELTHMMSVAQKVIAAGGNIEDIKQYISKDKGTETEPETLKRPESLVLKIENGESGSETMEINPKVIQEIKTSEALTNEFNKEFEKQYDPKFFEGLMKNYGGEQIRVMLDRMKEIKNSGGNIENPAGYLTKGLKNNSLNRETPTETETANIIMERRIKRNAENQQGNGNSSTLRNSDAEFENIGGVNENRESSVVSDNLELKNLSENKESSEESSKVRNKNDSTYSTDREYPEEHEISNPASEKRAQENINERHERTIPNLTRNPAKRDTKEKVKRPAKYTVERKDKIQNQQSELTGETTKNNINQKGMRDANRGADD